MKINAYDFWKKQLQFIHSVDPHVTKSIIDQTDVYRCFEISFQSVDGTVIAGKCWVNKQSTKNKLIILFHGLGAHTETDGYQFIAKRYVEYGYHVIGFDVRLQGGNTIDKNAYRFLEYGLYAGNIDILDQYYYIRVYQDALMLLESISHIKEIASAQWIATGGSQGAALALFVASMSEKIKGCMVDIPSCCDIPSLIHDSEGGFKQIKKLISDFPYLEKTILNHLTLIDLEHLTSHITCPVLASVGGLDRICPPKSFQQSFNQITSMKQYVNYENYGHGGYDLEHFPIKKAFLEALGDAR